MTDGPQITLISTISCPACGQTATERMPTEQCVYYYECMECGSLLKPEPGDCCVFCSFGSVPCPPVQLKAAAKPE
ncbi:MAG: GDCCVxC domain-containing (seleno)protein [Rhodospirillales bacterium]